MQILGIQLQTPSTSKLIVTVVLVGVVALVGAGLVAAGGVTFSNALMLTLGTLGGGLSSSYGVDLMKHGWRGAVLVVMFLITVVAIAFVAAVLAG